MSHYTGRVTYNTASFPEMNRDFVPPEIIESLRSSQDPHIRLMFTNQLNKCGNLTTLDETSSSSKKNEVKSIFYEINYIIFSITFVYLPLFFLFSY